MSDATPATSALRHNRKTLLIVLLLFFGVMLTAGALRFAGWRPHGMKNKGEMLQPYGDLRSYSPTLADGKSYRWQDSPRTWRMVTMPRDCEGARRAACQHLLENLDKVWRLMGREADRVHVLWAGAAPVPLDGLREVYLLRADAGLRAGLTQADVATGDSDPVWLVDPNGFVVLRYAPGFDPGDLRTDLARLLKIN
ncbi:hypothetical protein [Thermomonas sp.]|jgi:hypothetical protein|uniref:hypothetical protein n=1 Tax=Thermomonas sp. TaxID=1971895 RepID=UPI00239FA05D|nr:hypothetical protein [Thermomonas sp.]MBS0460182.1 hypothetical protein [Pseudomonadota bacterium]MDE2380920.1 hypothetical protein [Xanthomonadaceae bacterium]HOC11247.1 hypothetical protein [Thermomonas sp.]HOV96936.1 hypothetical protein [Thermomonas sp.]HQA02215.1 hypothetical protein [Thermomonas sp.]